MTPGTLLVDKNFLYSDGTTGKKIIVILNDGTIGWYIIVKTTSKGEKYGVQFGCQSTYKFPNFCFDAGSCILNKRTWVQLDFFYPHIARELKQKIIDEEINYIGVLEPIQTLELLVCASHSDEISVIHEKEIKKTIDNIKINYL